MRYTRAILNYLVVIFSYETVQGVSVITCGLHQRAKFECSLNITTFNGYSITWTINDETYTGSDITSDSRILSLDCTEELENSTVKCEGIKVLDPSEPNVPGDVFYVQIQGKWIYLSF